MPTARKKIVKKTKNYNSILRFDISGRWDIQDFSSFYKSIDVLYRNTYCTNEISNLFIHFKEFNLIAYDKPSAIESYMYFVPGIVRGLLNFNKYSFEFIQETDEIRFGIPGPFPFKEDDRFFDYQSLIVRRTQHSSPGFTDLLGISGLLKEIKELIQYYFPNKEGKEKAELLRQQRISLQIDNLKRIGFSDTEIQQTLLQEKIALDTTKKLISQEKLTDITITDE